MNISPETIWFVVGLGLVLLVCLIIYLMGGFRSRS